MNLRALMMAGGLSVVAASTASATPVSVDGTWYEFLFGAAISDVTGCGLCVPTSDPIANQGSAPPWTFTGPADLTVLDLFTVGDRFEAFDFGVSLGTTSFVFNSGLAPCGGNIGCALADASYSRLLVSLGSGAHSLTLRVIQNAAGSPNGGAAVFQLSSSAGPAPIPEPGTFLLVGGGVASILRYRRSMRRMPRP